MKKKGVRQEYSAGGVVFRMSPRGAEIAFILDPFGKWTFAKGHIEAGENSAQAALREVREEMGLRKLSIIAFLGRASWQFRETRKRARSPVGTRVRKFADYFLIQAPDGAALYPQKSELIRAAKWVAWKRAWAVSGYKDARPVLRRALDILQKRSTMYYRQKRQEGKQ